MRQMRHDCTWLGLQYVFVTCVNLNVFVRLCVAGGAMTNVTVVFVEFICAANCTLHTARYMSCHVLSRDVTHCTLSLSQHYQDHTFAIL